MDQQQQPPRISLEEIVVWLDERKKIIFTVIAIIGIGGLVFVTRQSSREGKENRATAALFQLQVETGASTNTPSAAQYQALLPKVADTGIAQHVQLREANSQFAAGKYAEAESAFDTFVKEHPSSPLLPEANFGLATSLEAQNKTKEALSKYQELTTRYPDSAFVGRSRLAQARIFEQENDQQQAFRIYQELASQNAGSMSQMGQATPLQMDATIAFRRLLKENPGLMQTNAPAASPTPSIAPTQLPTALPTKPPGS
ncbi:tetratricopeptide repeat protein [bacterium]|nr:tetratricopeptide repeat protein [bacterium]